MSEDNEDIKQAVNVYMKTGSVSPLQALIIKWALEKKHTLPREGER